MFISFEGTEGVGKTTLIKAIHQQLLAQGLQVVLTREPGGTPLAEDIRQLLLTKHDEAVDADCELLLMFAARAQHIAQVIQPALVKKHWVLSDRFVDASYAYQQAGRGLSLQKIDVLTQQFVSVMPSLTFWLDAPVEIGMQRAQQRGAFDRFEQEKLAFFERVRAGYTQRQAQEPQRIYRLDATQSAGQILAQALDIIKRHI
jgi:dTMP kinase